MEKLIFVYNADSGKLNALLDSIQKTINPSSSDCRLCELTYSALGERKLWKEWHNSLALESEFYHRDEFQKQYASKFGHKFEFPVVLVQNNLGLEVLLSKTDFYGIESLEQLIEEIDKRLH